MDIKQLEYFIQIVNSECNLSLAAQKLYVSQPALSLMIRTFEEQEDVSLFYRSRGGTSHHLQLTPAGKQFYEEARQIVTDYYQMISNLKENSGQLAGKVRLGIPPFIIERFFADILVELISNYPSIQIDVIEAGAFELSKMLMARQNDISIILQPSGISKEVVVEEPLIQREFYAFISSKNELSLKKELEWKDLNNQGIITFSEGFMTYVQLQNKFEEEQVKPKQIITSGSWAFLLKVAKRSNFIAILPEPAKQFIPFPSEITACKFSKPMMWKLAIAYPKKKKYQLVESFVRNFIIEKFRS